MRKGYIQASKNAVELQRSIGRMNQAGIASENIIIANTFTEIKEQLKPGDTIVVQFIPDICKGMKEFFTILESLFASEISFESVDEYAIRIDAKDTETFELLRQMSKVSQGLRARQSKQGLEEAVSKGKKLGRPPGMSEKIKRGLTLYRSTGKTVSDICRIVQCDKSTLYRYIREQKHLASAKKPQHRIIHTGKQPGGRDNE